ncbi:MAG: hypothetical protein Q9218_000520 [Villophora microphyllina]
MEDRTNNPEQMTFWKTQEDGITMSSRPRKSRHTPSPPVAIDEQSVQWEEPPASFTIDVKGDARNLEYGSRHRVPSYYRPSTRNVLGSRTTLGDNERAHRDKDLISRKPRLNLKHQKPVRIIRKADATFSDHYVADFVPLHLPKREKTREGPFCRRRPSYSPVTEGTTDEPSSDEDAPQFLTLDGDMQQERANVTRSLDRNAADWHAWMRLVELQDRIDGFSLSGSINVKWRSNAEVCLSIYDKALRNVTDLEGRAQLYLGMMSKALIVWERNKILSKWQTILGQCPLHLQLWKKYSDFHQSTLSGTTLEETRKQFLENLATLQELKHHAKRPPAEFSKIYTVQIYVLLRLSLLLSEGGYSEIAVATWQALLEVGFNKPTHLSISGPTTGQPGIELLNHARVADSVTIETPSTFEHFWDSEVPRIGEPNAKGWSSFKNGEGEQWRSLSTEGAASGNDSTIIKTWGDVERRVSGSSHMPVRTTDDSFDDPYRVILSSDVQSAMIGPPTPSDHGTLLSAFLCFCHLPPCPGLWTNESRVWNSDQFVQNQALYDHSRLAMSWLEKPSVSELNNDDLNGDITPSQLRDSSLPHVFQFPLVNFEISSESLFTSAGQWFSAFGSWGNIPFPIPKDFVLRTLQLLVVRGVGGDDLAEYVLALELQISPATVRKSAKSLLKRRPSSLRLYNAFTLIDHYLGNTEAAYQVCDTAIHMSTQLGDTTRRDAILLWRSRAWQHLTTGQAATALVRLLDYGLEDAPEETSEVTGRVPDHTSSTARLRLRNALTAGRDCMLSMSLPTHAVYFSDLLVLADYLTNDLSLETALSTFKTNLYRIYDKTPSARAIEALFRQSFARLLFIHISQRHPYSPAFIRSFLAESIAVFPHNTIFLSLYAWNESKFRIEDRVRGILRETVLANHQHCGQHEDDGSDHIATHFFAIYTDMHRRGLFLGSNHNAIRGSFERALSSEGAAHSAGLWKLYFLFEHGKGDPKRAKEVFWRAVGACPWAKEIYMLAFEYFREDGMDEGELRSVYDLMVRRELRIRVAL